MYFPGEISLQSYYVTLIRLDIRKGSQEQLKDTWTKPRGGWKQGREVGMAGVGGTGGGKCRQL